LTAALALVLVSLCGILAGVAPASAVASTVTCRSFSGDDSSTQFEIGGCTGHTGGGGTVSDMTVTWDNGATTFLAARAFAPTPIGTSHRCGATSGRYRITDRVTEDTSGSIKPGGRVSATLCILGVAPDTWSLAPGTRFTLT
jgi:hypothetical protein